MKELDLCMLGSCSRFWRELCGSDHIWAGLCKHRWPALGLDNYVVPQFNPHHLQQQHLDSNLKVFIIFSSFIFIYFFYRKLVKIRLLLLL